MDALLSTNWPSNVRELHNVIERATIVCQDWSFIPRYLALWSAPPAQVESTDLEVIERHTIERVMRARQNGNKLQASRRLRNVGMQLARGFVSTRSRRGSAPVVDVPVAPEALAMN